MGNALLHVYVVGRSSLWAPGRREYEYRTLINHNLQHLLEMWVLKLVLVTYIKFIVLWFYASCIALDPRLTSSIHAINGGNKNNEACNYKLMAIFFFFLFAFLRGEG